MARFNPFPRLSCTYGAPMGRHSTRHDFCGVKRFAVSRPQGEYDSGGAYWGSGGRGGPVWAVWEYGKGSATITLIMEHQALEYGLVLHLDLEYRLDSFHVHLTYQKLHQPQ